MGALPSRQLPSATPCLASDACSSATSNCFGGFVGSKFPPAQLAPEVWEFHTALERLCKAPTPACCATHIPHLMDASAAPLSAEEPAAYGVATRSAIDSLVQVCNSETPSHLHGTDPCWAGVATGCCMDRRPSSTKRTRQRCCRTRRASWMSCKHTCSDK